MFANYFRILFRNLRKSRLYAFINILSLGVGMAAMIWGMQDYRYYTDFDKFHVNRDRIFRVMITVAGGDGIKGPCPAPVAMAAVRDYPVVEKAIRWEDRSIAVLAPDKAAFSERVHFTDAAFFDLFTFPLVRGEAKIADRSTVLITETAAKKFFGAADPIGRTLVLYSDQPYKKPLTVTGILKDPPGNSSFQFETLTSTDNFLDWDGSTISNQNWGHLSLGLFLKLADPREAPKLAKAFSRYIPLEQAARQDIKVTSFALQSLSQTAAESQVIDKNAMLERPGGAAVYGPLILGILILVSSCLNFANTTVAQSHRRLKEIGVRKVMGSSYRQVMIQQLLECTFIVLPAIGLAMLLASIWLPVYSGMLIHLDLRTPYLHDHTLQGILVGLFFIVTFLAGAYPAFYISRFNATHIFRGAVRFGGRNLFSRCLLGLQIVIIFITLITSIAFARNAAFQRDYDYGYRQADIMGVWLPQGKDGKVLYDELSRLPQIRQLEGARDPIGFSYRSWPLEAEGHKKECTYLEVAPGYPGLMGLQLVAGSVPVSLPSGGESTPSYLLINEKLAFAMGWKPREAIGRVFRKDEKTTGLVVGVVKDFTQNSLQDPIQPLAIGLIAPEQATQWVIRAQPGRLGEVNDQVKTIWARLYPGTPLSTYFQDEVSAISIRLNGIITRIFSGFALITLFMAATGMFALVSLTVLKRMKEIAIRKVVGAGDGHILWLVGAGYGRIFLISALVGGALGFLMARQLLGMVFIINAGVRMDSLIISFLGILALSGAIILSRVFSLGRGRTAEVLKAE